MPPTSSQAPSAESQRNFANGIFADQVAVVTGGGSGIGLATALELGRLGARVAICGRTVDRLEGARPALVEATGSTDRVLALPCDIREAEQVETFVKAVVDAWGAVDILVNNAGGQFPAPAQQITPNGFAAVIKNNLLGTFNMCREVATRSMIPRTSGRIVNVTANVYRGFPGMAHTGAARAGVENLTLSLAVEWSQFGILVNAIAPGVIASTGTARYPVQLLARAAEQTPLKRTGTCEEVAASIVFLASPAAQYITGTILRVDGAQALWGDTWQVVS
jgi:citronellol/citronellal dehydrogenase